jgi:two-component system, NtrC family, nitrogen regulation response regulator NtrX
MAADILIVDDEADIRELIAGILQDEGFETRLAHNSDAAIAEINQRRPSMIVLDIWLQGSRLDGLDLLLEIKKLHADLPVVIISGHGNIETAVSAIKRGAYDFIEKPFNADRLLLIVNRALEASRLRRENVQLREKSGFELELKGDSQTMRQLRQTLKKIAPTNSRVLVSGQAGVGKELTARVLHEMSARATGPFVVLSAAAMAPDRMEEELFGVEQTEGAPRVGALEEAHGGTLFIDEVADMPLETQAKVLRVLLEQTFQRVNGSKKVKVDVRIVSSTSRDLQALIGEQKFREDLYHRLSVVPLVVPGLAERREDIPSLIEHFAKSYSAASGQPVRRFSQEAMAMLQAREWRGNVRELKNNVERIMIMAAGENQEEISAALLPNDEAARENLNALGGDHLLALPLRDAREVFERDYIAAQLARFGGNISRTALFIGMERSALHRKIKILGLAAKDQQDAA